VTDPDAPGNYLLGIEFDGPLYHSAATVRDRERLRPEMLHSLGWTLHRIWAADWVNRRQEEIDRLVHALEDAKRTKSGKPNNPPKSTSAPRPARAGQRL
jgi:very-short-patch-repair endonuclease